ncbi:MAG: carboxylate--amine ligase [Candidatus Omnitrophica bacterium]|nr:carboxylate--amine ligase [Candidatus Omnitrophota bacterium]
MKIKRIIVTGAGGSPSTNFIRSLRKVATEKFFIIGVDCNEYYLQRAETDVKFLAPYANDRVYLDVLKQIIKETGAEFIYSQPDPEIFRISQHRKDLKVRVFLPAHRTIKICQNKMESYRLWRKAGIRVPETCIINTAAELKKAFLKLGRPVWLRAIVSHGGGKDSFCTDDFNVARAWIKHCKGWGVFSASEYLSSRTATWLSIWKEGELIVAQGRKRLYWEFGNRAPSGVTGLTGTGVTISDPLIDDIARKAIAAIDKKPHGIFGVDLTYDRNGIPSPTEINIGRFFTTHQFFTEAGLNMPYIFVKIAFGEEYPPVRQKINPLPDGLTWIRGMDFLPILTTIDKIEDSKNELAERIKKIKGI